MLYSKLYFIGVLLLFFACQTKQSENKTIFEQKGASTPISPLDTLNKYGSSDSTLLFYDALNAVLLINKVNAHKYAAWIITDSILVFYQQDLHQQWHATDTLQYELDFSFVKHEDLNGDRLRDIKISCISGAAGNLDNRVFLFDKITKTFKHNSSYDLLNVEYDTLGKFIKSWRLAGAVHCQEKWRYKITGDSLIFDLGISYCPDENTQGATGILVFYKEMKDSRLTLKEVKGEAPKLWNTFKKSLWDSPW